MEKRIVIIDGNSLINRAYYAIQRPMITKEGLYTQGVYGFLNMLTKINSDYTPEYIAVAFDRKAPTFRHNEYDQYKAGRKSMPDELAMQLPLLKEVLSAMKICMLEIDGFEADDIIGTVAKRAESEGLYPLIITGDRDELQLATDKTSVLITKKGISEFEIYDENAMIDKYGFTPKQFIDYKGLAGDQSDNIPGIPGVGDKTATKLIKEYGSVENLIMNIDEMPAGKLKSKIEENAQLAVMSKRLATIFTDVPIEFSFDEMHVFEPDYEALTVCYKKLEFNSFLKKLAQSGIKKDDFEKSASSGSKEYKLPNAEIVMADSKDVLEKLLKDINSSENVVIKTLTDNNHKDIPFIYGISLLIGSALYYIDGANEDYIREAAHALVSASNGRLKISGFGLKKDYYALLSAFPELIDISGNSDFVFNTGFDIEIAAYLIDPARSSYNFSLILFENLREEIEDEDKLIDELTQVSMLPENTQKKADYCLKYCTSVEVLKEIFSEKLKNAELERVFYDAELPLIEVLASMEVSGFKIDKEKLIEIGESVSGDIDAAKKKIHMLAGEEFNINSPVKLGEILFEKLGLPSGKKTKKGYSTSAEVLEKLRPLHPIIDLILEYRSLTKLKSTYVDGLIPLIGSDGRIHAHFQQTVTATGRISCTEPNLQNIPVRQELGRTLRRAFIANTENDFLVGADYSQIELRVLAHLSGDENLIEAFNQGEDIHRSTASKVFDVPQNEVTSEQRSAAKAVNFGVIYGMSSFGLSSEIHVSRKQAEKYIDEYFKRFPDVKKFMDGRIESCKKNGYLLTLMGRRRYINEINASSYMTRQLGERLAMNSPVQGSAADIIKLAMISVYKNLRKNGVKSKLILQVHDELIIEASDSEKDAAAEILKSCMENVMPLKVKLISSLSIGKSWYELK